MGPYVSVFFGEIKFEVFLELSFEADSFPPLHAIGQALCWAPVTRTTC